MNQPSTTTEFLASPASVSRAAPITPAATFQFDGRRFSVWSFDAATISLLYLAKKARGGDADAAALLDARHALLHDAEGQQYYPPVVAPAVGKPYTGGGEVAG